MMKTKLFFLSLGGISFLGALSLEAIDRPAVLPEAPSEPAQTSCAAKPALPSLEKEKKDVPVPSAVPSVWLGIVPMPMPAALLSQLNLNAHSGLLVRSVGPESPAKKAGVQEYDVLLSVHETPLRESKDISRALLETKPGQKIVLEIIRGMKPQKLEVVLEARPTQLAQMDGLMDGSKALQDHWNEQKETAGELQKRILPLVRSQRLSGGTGRGASAGGLGAAALPSIDPQVLMADSMAQMLEDMMGSHADLRNQILPLLQRGAPHFKSPILEMQQALEALEAENPPALPTSPASFSQMSSSFNFRISDGQGTILLQKNNGKTQLKVTGPQGKVLFEGPYDSQEEKNALPSEVRERVERIQMQE